MAAPHLGHITQRRINRRQPHRGYCARHRRQARHLFRMARWRHMAREIGMGQDKRGQRQGSFPIGSIWLQHVSFAAHGLQIARLARVFL